MKLKQDSKQIQAHELVKEICVRAYDVESLSENQELSQSLFVAAEVGNVEFLIELIRFDLELALKTDQTNRSIFHIAVKERHESIFNLLHEIGSFKDLIVENTTNGGNNMLHLAAKLAPQHKLNAISGAALQLQQELLWFKVLIICFVLNSFTVLSIYIYRHTVHMFLYLEIWIFYSQHYSFFFLFVIYA